MKCLPVEVPEGALSLITHPASLHFQRQSIQIHLCFSVEYAKIQSIKESVLKGSGTAVQTNICIKATKGNIINETCKVQSATLSSTPDILRSTINHRKYSSTSYKQRRRWADSHSSYFTREFVPGHMTDEK